MRIIFLHPDLGIGGAERLVVDAGLAIQSKGYSVEYLTAHHDPAHCFPETNDGTLKVECKGDWLPRTIFGRFHAVCAYVRMVFLALVVVFGNSVADESSSQLVLFVDQVSACIPVIRLFSNHRVIFYCHYPDQLLTNRESWSKRLYRWPVDWFEEWSTGLAHVVLVNSNFTALVFRNTFRTLSKVPLTVLYPSINFSSSATSASDLCPVSFVPARAKHVLLSINRYERKKNIALAVQALALLETLLPKAEWNTTHLVIAGGYDVNVPENVEHHLELEGLVENLGISDHVSFIRSMSDGVKHQLLSQALCLLYTPSNEHFGIVPLEAMQFKTPVIAINSGGPLETVVDGETGYLVSPESEQFAGAIKKLIENPKLAAEFGDTGRKRLLENFSFNAFADNLEKILINNSSNIDVEPVLQVGGFDETGGITNESKNE